MRIVHQGRLDPDIELIEKPFRGEDLAARVRAMLDSAGGQPAGDAQGDAQGDAMLASDGDAFL